MASDIALIPALGHDKNEGKAYMAQWKSFLSTGTTAAAVPHSWAQGLLTRSGLDGNYTDRPHPRESPHSQCLRVVCGPLQGLLQGGVLAYLPLVRWCTAGAQHVF